MAQKIINKEILVKYFQGDTTPDENIEILEWLKEGAENLAAFNRLKQTWEVFQPQTDVPNEPSWNQLNKRLLLSDSSASKPRILPLIMRYAAVFVLGLAIYFVTDRFIINTPLAESELDFQYNEIIVPKGEKSQVVLSDGTKVWLNSDTKFRYPSSFNDMIRTVYLEGEAYFDVSRRKKQTFVVKTDELNVRVLGTTFNVKNYAEDDYIETTLVSGRIVVEQENDKDQTVVLKPNQKATFSKIDDKLTVTGLEDKPMQDAPLKKKPISVSRVDVEPITSWKDQELVFDNETLIEAGVKLERWYGIQIEVNNEDLKDIRYKGRFDKHYTIYQVLEVIKLTTPIRYTSSDNKIVIDIAEGLELRKKKPRFGGVYKD